MSSAMLVLAAVKPWTYWMWPPLVAIAVLAGLAVVAGYYRKIMVPRYEWSLYEAALQRGTVTPLAQRSRRDEFELDRAA